MLPVVPLRLFLWLIVLPVLVALLFPPAPALGQGDEETCPGTAPTPVAVAVTAVPIVVPSTTADYFVLYVRFGTGSTASELPVAVVRGQDGTTTLTEHVEALPAARYRVEKYGVSDPADIDGDCLDDLTELDDATMSPVNFAVPEFTDGTPLTSSDGAVYIPDRAAFETLAQFRNGVHTIKFVIFGMETNEPALYFMNTNRHQSHYGFNQTVDSRSRTVLNAALVHDSSLVAPGGGTGTYYFVLAEYYREGSVTGFDTIERAYTLLAANLAFLDDDLDFHIPNGLLPAFQDDLAALRESRIDVLFTEDIYADADFIALNRGESLGYLREMEPDERPGPRDIVLYDTLPNELPRVAGIISTVAQTPLSHVNLRAIQDNVPNAYIRAILDDTAIAALVDRPIAYTVTASTWNIRAATVAEVDAHHAALRPPTTQTPQRDLAVTEITPLCRVGFGDWDAFGVKAANVAVLGTLGFGDGGVPDGFAVPFSFYDEFMKANDLYTRIDTMLAVEHFSTDLDVQEAELKTLRKAIKDAATPEWITVQLTRMHNAFPAGQSLRYRSSTNNEDLPGFNGAGLYDSKTQHPEETKEDGISKSLKQVYASLWNFRAFAEREFYRVDHKAAAMGVLVHPNYSDELANGVAVSFDPFDRTNPEYGTGPFYINTQVGEDLVTNPEAHSVPEEILLNANGTYYVRALSNLVEQGELLLSDAQLRQLRARLETIHDHFEQLYAPAVHEPFAMEIEFKITSANVLAIKQARPWVFPDAVGTGSSEPSDTGMPDACTPSRLSSLGPVTRPSRPPRSPGGGGGGSGGGGGGGGGSRDLHGNTAAAATLVRLDRSAPWASSTAGQINEAADIDYFELLLPHAGVVVVETTGATDTQGTVWQAGEEVARAARGGRRRNFRLRTPVAAGSLVVAVTGNGRQTGAYELAVTLTPGYLENPGPESFQSGVGVVSGWVCAADTVELEIGHLGRQVAAYGTERVDTEGVCGDVDNGFGLLFNWNLLEDGDHEVVALVDGVELGRARVTVTTVGEEFVRDLTGTCPVADFPTGGEHVTVAWQQSKQNFVITSGSAPSGDNRAGTAGVGYLENPGPNSFQSGIGVLSGWVCEAETVELEIGHLGRQVAAYGTERLDTLGVCGDVDNGFGLLFNWNLLGEGEHEVAAYVDDIELGRATVKVTTLGTEFLRGAEGECVVADFPTAGEAVLLEWQQNSQNFVMTDVQ